AAKFPGDLKLRVYTSRLLGRDKTLVLHGGGNTSVKIRERNLFGDEEEILYVKGSGSDLETIEESGFAPVRLEAVLCLASLESLSDPQMVNELKASMTNASAPTPSVETILHALLPYKYVDHTHADALLAVTNTPEARERVLELYGDEVVIIPYVMPGFQLARECAKEFERQKNRRTMGMVLLKHGIFSFAETAKESYERMIRLVSRAEEYLQKHRAWSLPDRPHGKSGDSAVLPRLRRDISAAAGMPMILQTHDDARCVTFARREDLPVISQQGPATPDHVIRTKRVPMLGRDVSAYRDAYKEYFSSHAAIAPETKAMLDPAPRIALDPEFGMIAAGRSAKEANIAAEIYRHTMDIIERASLLSSYQPVSEPDLFEVEYWDLEQAKLKKSGTPPLFTGEIALVTGAASGIGKACVESLLSLGAAVTALDINSDVASVASGPGYLGVTGDVTSEADVSRALDGTVKSFGGLDMLVLNAGIFPATRDIADLSTEEWRRVMQINLDANLILMRQCLPLLKLAPKGGRVVIVGSKNVPAPGPGAAAYSASKAALNQLARVAALEWGKDGIRVNVVHPNAVFDTGVWTEEVLRSRAQSYGLSIEAYKKNNVLETEVSSRDVAQMVVSMCGPVFAKTTGAQVPVDGGNDRVI
ncbi:MAG TPA: bifunctional aldolase/short-chain dehydrogenase, partial [Burkholderiales bacterium]|nr:bifunctional aldolase/short-chain dehydrogenase [Burkholderiales bacterium]